ncbi:MAG: hypothetical protein KZQ70_03755 [gamma proteobacterium symbiont of Lucinoma myriamae]|nr:hypothetical protein [gamma proteobacterium symbiont of Lucinoma myriamae]MCU7819878.1 hypothetical protein [gamma proteobacterium symbiont of Lucinoma myriamae]MCU7831695.1 hypothetical protein [gamma proteobacterium symbiont of Lucinoma myriamae]
MKFFIILSLLLLVACQSPLIQTNTSYLKPVSDSTIEITQSIEVSPNYARAFLQSGNVIPPVRLNSYSVNCEVEINTVSETRQIIKPEKFDIIEISQEESPIVMLKPVMVASLNHVSSSPADIKRFFRFHLSAQDPESKSQVRALICRGVQAAHGKAQLPTLEQMQAAAGTYIKFNL